jgi:hypothetical protein
MPPLSTEHAHVSSTASAHRRSDSCPEARRRSRSTTGTIPAPPEADHILLNSMSSLLAILNLVSYGIVAALAAALVACAIRRWLVAANVARAVVLTGLLVVVASVVSVMRPLSVDDPAAKAVALSQGISEALNCGGIALVASVVGAVIWDVARRRLRSAGGGPAAS